MDSSRSASGCDSSFFRWRGPMEMDERGISCDMRAPKKVWERHLRPLPQVRRASRGLAGRLGDFGVLRDVRVLLLRVVLVGGRGDLDPQRSHVTEHGGCPRFVLLVLAKGLAELTQSDVLVRACIE